MLVWTTALSTRLIAGFLFPNAEQDGYSYVETIREWSDEIANHSFGVSRLFGFWLPGFQFVAAVANLAVHDALLAGKLVSSATGAVDCVLVYALALRISRSSAIALCAFAIIVLAPLHLIYSAAAMTDIPFNALVVGSAWFASQKRWPAAAVCGAAAEAVRLEAWALVLALPLLQLLFERRMSLATVLIPLVVPAFWLVICRYATGDWLAYFVKRANYQHQFLEYWPSRGGFTVSDVRHDFADLLFGANGVVFVALVASIWVAIKARRGPRIELATPLSLAVYGGAIGALLLGGYVTKRQPVILPRYGLIFFTLGTPCLVWLIEQARGSAIPRYVRYGMTTLAMLLLVRGSIRQLPLLHKVRSDFAAQQQIATTLSSIIGESVCFSDDPAVRVLSGVPASQFLRTETTPAAARANATAFDDYLRERGANLLVFMQTEDSLPVKFHPELRDLRSTSIDRFELIDFARSSFGPDVALYRVR